VLGGAGFIGSHAVDLLLSSGFRNITVVDSFSESLYPSIRRRAWASRVAQENGKRVAFLEEDYISPRALDICKNADVVVNMVAIAGLRKSWASPMEVLETNFVKFNSLIEHLAASSPSPYFIHASTSSVYGSYATSSEDAALRPVSPYGISKLAAEKVLLTTRTEGVLRWTALRFFSVYGPRQRSDMAYSKAITAAIEDQEFKIYGDGRQSRTNTYVSDAAAAILKTMLIQPEGEFINVAGDEEYALSDVLSLIQDKLGRPLKIVFTPSVPGDQANTKGSIEKAGALLGWQPSVTLPTGLSLQIKEALEFK
jgi:UDP-glucuronate 4-epimerase